MHCNIHSLYTVLRQHPVLYNHCPGRAVSLHLRIEDNNYSTAPIGGIPDDQVPPASRTVVRHAYKEILQAFLQTACVC